MENNYFPYYDWWGWGSFDSGVGVDFIYNFNGLYTPYSQYFHYISPTQSSSINLVSILLPKLPDIQLDFYSTDCKSTLVTLNL